MSKWYETVSVTIVPASPGWFVLDPVQDEDGQVREFHREPVIAWRIELGRSERRGYFTMVNPVTVEHVPDAGEIMQRPDGRIAFAVDRDFHDEEEALAYATEIARTTSSPATP